MFTAPRRCPFVCKNNERDHHCDVMYMDHASHCVLCITFVLSSSYHFLCCAVLCRAWENSQTNCKCMACRKRNNSWTDNNRKNVVERWGEKVRWKISQITTSTSKRIWWKSWALHWMNMNIEQWIAEYTKCLSLVTCSMIVKLSHFTPFENHSHFPFFPFFSSFVSLLCVHKTHEKTNPSNFAIETYRIHYAVMLNM